MLHIFSIVPSQVLDYYDNFILFPNSNNFQSNYSDNDDSYFDDVDDFSTVEDKSSIIDANPFLSEEEKVTVIILYSLIIFL